MRTIYHAFQSDLSGEIFVDRDTCAMAEDAEASAIIMRAAADGLDLLGALRRARSDDRLWIAIQHLSDRRSALAADYQILPGEDEATEVLAR